MACSNCHLRLGHDPIIGDYVRICVCGECSHCHLDYIGQPNVQISYSHWLCEDGVPLPFNQNESDEDEDEPEDYF